MNELDNAIHDMEQLFAHFSVPLKRERNSVNRVASLPSNVIASILGQLDIQDVIAGSNVCHWWRAAALIHADIWATIDLRQGRRSGLLQAQLARSGVIPLTAFFPGEGSNHKSWPDIDNLLIRCRVIAGVVTSTFPRNGPLNMPSLESLHIINSSLNPIESCIGKCPKLQHISIDCGGLLLSPNQPNWNFRLLTLHLRNSNMTALDTLRFVLMFPLLEELSLNTCRNTAGAPTDLVDFLINSHPSPSFKVLSLEEVEQPFIEHFLKPSLIQKDTFVHVCPFFGWNIIREDAVGSVWIDRNARIILFDHGTALTNVIYTRRLRGQGLPIPVQMGAVSFVIIFNGGPISSKELSRFGNLTKLSFILEPTFTKNSLSKTLNQTLIFACPYLSYLGIGLRGSSSLDREEVEEVLVEFYQNWLDTHGERFAQISINDGFDGEDWDLKSSLSNLVDSVNVVDVELIPVFIYIPEFPKPRWFHH